MEKEQQMIFGLRSWNRKQSNKRSFSRKISGNTLTKLQKKEIQDFYKPITGKTQDYLYHEFYSQKTGAFYANYIPDDLYYGYIDLYFNDRSAAIHLDNKCYYRLLLSDIPQPEMIVCRVNGIWFCENENDLCPITMEKAIEKISQNQSVLKQAIGSVGGHGVWFSVKGASPEQIRAKLEKMEGDIVAQREIRQSSVMNRLNPTSVNTVRVMSFLERDGSVKICSVIVRMGVRGARVDNASSGGITCGVTETGRLKGCAYTAWGDRYNSHPDTKLDFASVTIPNFEKLCSMIQKAHLRFAHFRLLSWDVAIDENDEPMLVEVNLSSGELDFHQLNNGPLFGKDTKKILQEVFQK